MKKKIQKGTIAYFGSLGHRGFEYPSKESEKLLFDVDADMIPWVGGGKFKPFRVPEDAMLALGDSNKNIIVWIHA